MTLRDSRKSVKAGHVEAGENARRKLAEKQLG
jgi:hypothetical protein